MCSANQHYIYCVNCRNLSQMCYISNMIWRFTWLGFNLLCLSKMSMLLLEYRKYLIITWCYVGVFLFILYQCYGRSVRLIRSEMHLTYNNKLIETRSSFEKFGDSRHMLNQPSLKKIGEDHGRSCQQTKSHGRKKWMVRKRRTRKRRL